MKHLLFLLSIPLFAQPQYHVYTANAPTGACPARAVPVIVLSTGTIYTCGGGTWVATGTVSPTGTVTNVTGTANEITVATGSTTPALSIAAVFDISGKTSTAPIKKGTSLPATCSVGQLYNKTDATSSAVLYACTATNIWTQQGATSPSCTTTITTGTTATLSTCFTINQHATAGTAVAYTLPTASSGAQYCIDNSWNGSAPNTGVLTFATSASGQFMVFTDGTLTATGGNVTSGGAARDGACVYGIDSTHWMFLPHSGTWTKN